MAAVSKTRSLRTLLKKSTQQKQGFWERGGVLGHHQDEGEFISPERGRKFSRTANFWTELVRKPSRTDTLNLDGRGEVFNRLEFEGKTISLRLETV